MIPNTYELDGDGVKVTLFLPKFTQIDSAAASVTLRGKAHNFSGKQITVENTKVGALISFVLEHVPDLHDITFAVLIPSINLASSLPAVTGPSFDTTGVICTSATTIAGPPKGVVQTNVFVKLHGKSSLHPQH
jgi:hypothetical protein